MTGLFQTSSEETRPRSSSLWFLVGTPLVLGPELASRLAEHSHSGGCFYIFLIYCFYHLTRLCNNFYGLSTLVGCSSSAFIRRIIYKFLNVCPFDYTAFAVSGEIGIPLTGQTTPIEWMLSVAILIDRRKSVPQLLCNWTLQYSEIFKLNVDAMGFHPL